MSIRQFIFKHKIKKSRAKHELQKKFVSYNNTRSILLLYESEENEENYEIKSIVYLLETEGKRVTSCGFVHKKKADTPTLEHSYMLDLSHINILKEPNKSFVEGLLSHKYDIVLDLTLTENLPLMYILAYANAPFKVGRKTEDNLLDFMIDIKPLDAHKKKEETSKINYLFQQIIFYLKSIVSNN